MPAIDRRSEDDELVFADEREAGPRVHAEPWQILIVDDEPEVHLVTRLALADLRIEGRPLEILQANSSAEAKPIVAQRPELALVMLDVVMESEHAGLELVRWIREQLGNRRVRLVLRTGQPGSAPEQQVMLEYDINDYRAKTEITAQRLITTVIAAIRSFRDLCTIESQRRGLELALHEQQALLAVFERFVPKRALELLELRDAKQATLGDHVQREMAVVFVDLRSFTPLAERLGAGKTFEFVNAFFAAMVPVVQDHEGIVDSYTGDGLIALFNSPADAVLAGIGLLAATEDFADHHPELPTRPRIGVGVNCGPLILGLCGSSDRLAFTVVGDCVNAAARVERLTRDYGSSLLLTGAVHARLPDELRERCRRLGRVALRGKQEQIELFELELRE